MTYSEYRNQFSNIRSFIRDYGKLTLEEAEALIDADDCPPGIKTCLIDMWHEARRLAKLSTIAVFYSEYGNLTITFMNTTASLTETTLSTAIRLMRITRLRF